MRRMDGRERCKAHGLAFDPTKASGCVVCLREAEQSTSSHAPTAVSAQASTKKPFPWSRVGAVAPFVLIGLTVLVVGVVVLWDRAHRERVAPGNSGGVAPSVQIRKPKGPMNGLALRPLVLGTRWTYRQKTELDGKKEDFTTRVYEARPDDHEGEVILTHVDAGMMSAYPMSYTALKDGVYTSLGFFGAGRTEFSPPFLELPAELQPGAEWTWSGSSSGTQMEITSAFEGLETVTVPAGTYECARVVRTLKKVQGHKTLHFYAEGVGLVKMEGSRPAAPPLIPASTMLWELVAFEPAQ
ncbi:MAG: hypothetical protein U0271_12025 [Polyangiaceae bacterium]